MHSTCVYTLQGTLGEHWRGKPLPSFSDFLVFLIRALGIRVCLRFAWRTRCAKKSNRYFKQTARIPAQAILFLRVTSSKWGLLLDFESWTIEGMAPLYGGEDGCRHVGSSSRRVILALHEGPRSGPGSSHANRTLNIKYC